MLLRFAHVTDFKSINDSTEVGIEPDVTCLVGKNESGKTAFIEAIFKLNPLEGKGTKFDSLMEYPRSRRNEDRDSIKERTPITATFELEDDEVRALEDLLGENCLAERTVQVSRSYEDELVADVALNHSIVVRNLVLKEGLDEKLADGCHSVEELHDKLAALSDQPPTIAPFCKKLASLDIDQKARDLIGEWMPGFLFFDNYSTLPGVFSIPYIQGRKRSQLDRNEITAKALLELAGVDAAEFTTGEYERRRAALEAAASQVSRQAFKYWKQNTQLRVFFDSDFQKSAEGEKAAPWLQVRIENLRHGMTLNFEERSTGFVWFFSFFTYFSSYRKSKKRVIILLDEPGLSLHAAGQADLLEMIDKELAPKHQVIYTTHSPFMIRASQLNRVRTVEDVDDVGTSVTAEVYRNKRDTLFPLQAALGYTIAQTLFVGPDNLVVEGPSDMIYLQIMSDYLKQKGRAHLSPRWTLVPAGGIDKVPAFISLYGTQLNIAVLLDSGGGNQRVEAMVEQGLLEQSKLIAMTEFTRKNQSDIEDMFGEDFYLDLLATSGGPELSKATLPPANKILRRIEAHLGKRIDHFAPANHFLLNQAKVLPKLEVAAADRFEALFLRVNPLLSAARA